MINIGIEIKKIILERGINITYFAKQIGTTKRNTYNIFERNSIDTELLRRISNALQYNFFKLYQPDIEIPVVMEPQSEYRTQLDEPARVMLQVEISGKKKDELLQYILKNLPK